MTVTAPPSAPQVRVRVPPSLLVSVHDVPSLPGAPFMPFVPFVPLVPLVAPGTMNEVPSSQRIITLPGPASAAPASLATMVHEVPSLPAAPSLPEQPATSTRATQIARHPVDIFIMNLVCFFITAASAC
jgi:hypothetical protein